MIFVRAHSVIINFDVSCFTTLDYEIPYILFPTRKSQEFLVTLLGKLTIYTFYLTIYTVNLARLLRAQHENLVRRRSEAISEYGEANLAANVNSIVKQLEQTFKGTAAQKSFRESHKARGLNGWHVGQKQKSRFTAMVKEEYGGEKIETISL